MARPTTRRHSKAFTAGECRRGAHQKQSLGRPLAKDRAATAAHGCLNGQSAMPVCVGGKAKRKRVCAPMLSYGNGTRTQKTGFREPASRACTQQERPGHNRGQQAALPAVFLLLHALRHEQHVARSAPCLCIRSLRHLISDTSADGGLCRGGTVASITAVAATNTPFGEVDKGRHQVSVDGENP